MFRRRFVPRWIAGIILFLIAGIIFFRVYLVPNAVDNLASVLKPADDTIERAELENYLALGLPDEATDFHGAVYSFMQSRIIGISFQIPPDNLDVFLNQLGFTSKLKVGVNPFHTNSHTLDGNDWWRPETAKSFVGGSITKSESFYDILVDQTSADYFLVYLMVEQI
jgi:hypothetical protein